MSIYSRFKQMTHIVVLGGLLVGGSLLIFSGCEQAPPPPPPPAKVEREAPEAPEEEDVIESIPTPAFAYEGSERREPFKTLIREALPDVQDVVLTPEPEEILSPLQQFDLQQIVVVGIILGGLGDYARIKAPDGESYTINVGTLMGTHRGKVIAISENAIHVKETIEYQSGNVEELETSLYLDPEEDKD